jgi:hypothetical protein
MIGAFRHYFKTGQIKSRMRKLKRAGTTFASAGMAPIRSFHSLRSPSPTLMLHVGRHPAKRSRGKDSKRRYRLDKVTLGAPGSLESSYFLFLL